MSLARRDAGYERWRQEEDRMEYQKPEYFDEPYDEEEED